MSENNPVHPVVPAENVTAEWLTQVLAAAGRLTQGRVSQVAYVP